MSKKKKKKKSKKYDDMGFIKLEDDSKSLEKSLKKVMRQIEVDRVNIYEADKKDLKNIKHKKKINKEEQAFISSMRGLKKRKKVLKRWKKDGLFGKVIEILKEGGKAAKTIGKCVAKFIILILSIDTIADKISPKMLNTLNTIFYFAVAI